jgi:PIN domain nuclease of toxin-antitoxin system
VNVLLDTCALLWWAADSPRLGRRARKVIVDPENTIYVSVVSAWEVIVKARKYPERIPGGASLVPVFGTYLSEQGFLPLPLTLPHVERSLLMAEHHRDPYDRMLIAQALETGYPLVTCDELFDQYGVPRIW